VRSDPYLRLQPFEVCSIRPPTENSSLSFKLTRGCYWNKCAFCPVYKTGTRFSRRTLSEVGADIERAKHLDDFLFEAGLGVPAYSDADYARLEAMIEQVERRQRLDGVCPEPDESREPQVLDARLDWFKPWFRDTPSLRDSLTHILAWRIGGARTCFLGDADGLILKPDFMRAAIRMVKSHFPTVARFTVYGRTHSAARLRTIAELAAYREAGLNRVHFGIESGSDAVLAMVHKGETKAQHIDGVSKARSAGLSCALYVMPGLGGTRYSAEHAAQTADVINQTRPDFVRLRTLQIFPATPLEEAVLSGAFSEADEAAVVAEIRDLIAGITVPTEIISDSATNLLDIQGNAVKDRSAMLSRLDGYLALEKRQQLLFSLQSRLSAFIGQYGELSLELLRAISPWIRDGRLACSSAGDAALRPAIDLIRGRLMP